MTELDKRFEKFLDLVKDATRKIIDFFSAKTHGGRLRSPSILFAMKMRVTGFTRRYPLRNVSKKCRFLDIGHAVVTCERFLQKRKTAATLVFTGIAAVLSCVIVPKGLLALRTECSGIKRNEL